MLLTTLTVQAQIQIGGNVYGGGNAGNVSGNSAVNVRSGNLNNVYGGARMANVGGNAFVNIDGAHASDYIIANKVYGGNDISGTIGKTSETKTVPQDLTHAAENHVDNTWDAFVQVSTKTDADTGEEKADAKPVYIGQLFAGGNGDYHYSTTKNAEGKFVVKESESSPTSIATSTNLFTKPVLSKTYLEVCGGTIVYAYGGGNNATVTGNTVVYVNNPSKVVNSIKDSNITTENDGELLTTARFEEMGINTKLSSPSSDEFQIDRFFGGNNKAEMAIRPTWNLQAGKIRNIYSGGNKGAMTNKEGLLLEINPSPTGTDEQKKKLVIDNVYGGCRMADVTPLKKGTLSGDHTPSLSEEIQLHNPDGTQLYNFPAGLSARVLVRGGDINNVYGGNDITGNVTGGNAVGVYTSIRGNVYGGGNGSYAYTDNTELANDDSYSDLYYSIPDGKTSAQALNDFRPNAEQVSIRLAGTDADHPTIIHGSVYVGGNSATLSSTKTDPLVELKIGSHVIADNVYLGNNGENMVTNDILTQYANNNVEGNDFSKIDLTVSGQMQTYMEAVAMPLMPRVVFDKRNADGTGDPATYIDYSSSIGSLFCGGNKGSMTVPGKTIIDFERALIIYNKVVGGCNDAYVPAADGLNAEYYGGIIGSASETPFTVDGTAGGAIKDRLELNFDGLKIQPKRWNADQTQLVWNVISAASGEEISPENLSTGTSTPDDLDRRLKGGNIYGGCYAGGHVNGNVIINLNASLVDRKKTGNIKDDYVLFDEIEQDEGEAKLYGNDSYNIRKRYTGVILNEQGMDVLGKALNVFGGGYGEDSEIWGSTTINLNAGYAFQIFGGGEHGAIGKGVRNATTKKLEYAADSYDPRYSTTINLNGDKNIPGTYRGDTDNSDNVTDDVNMAEAELIYGGAFEGPILGNTVVNLGNGRVFNAFAGSCNADIHGHAEMHVGQWMLGQSTYTGFPWVRDHIYGGNDLGGRILGKVDFSAKVNPETLSKVYQYDASKNPTPAVLTASSYTEYVQGRVDNIFGGCYGDYDYSDLHYKDYTYYAGEEGIPEGKKAGMSRREDFYKPRLDNAFVNFKPNTNARNTVSRVFGAGQGHTLDSDRDIMQNRSYILIDVPQDLSNYTGMEVFGSGASTGLGMKDTFNGLDASPTLYTADKDKYSAIIDLARGQIAAAYGGSFHEGITRRTLVNVMKGSTIQLGSIFGGAYGEVTLKPCDVYEANVEYHSDVAKLIYSPVRTEKDNNNNDVVLGDSRYKGAIYGGNNQERRTIYGKINIDAPVLQQHYKYGLTKATVYGAGCGANTWSEYTEVNLNDGAQVYEVYGGGEAGRVINAESVQAYMNNPKWLSVSDLTEVSDARWIAAWKMGGGYDPVGFETQFSNGSITGYSGNASTNLNNSLARTAEVDDRATKTNKYNTNVIINKGAYVANYAYGGGLGTEGVDGSGGVYGTTYIALLGGRVNKDIYAAGTSGDVCDIFGTKNFTASATAYIQGGSVRNVYGGGWEGSVGKHTGATVTVGGKTKTLIFAGPTTDDILGETHVVIGKTDGTSFTDGLPAIERNAYGGGEGGAVFGTTHLTLYNGFIGYRRYDVAPGTAGKTEWASGIASIKKGDDYYYEKLNDETWDASQSRSVTQSSSWTPADSLNRLKDSGCLFGGGYVDNSSVDDSNVKMYGGHVRNAIFGGGEIAAIGRGLIEVSGQSNSERSLKEIYKAGKTHVELFDGHVHRNVFGGGRGYNNLGGVGTLYSDGFVFGQTEVHVHGGEVGTLEGVVNDDGNVFGGGDIGYVYSAYEDAQGNLRYGKKSGTRWHGSGEGYYYQAVTRDPTKDDFILNSNEKVLTEDCRVLIEPYCKATDGVTIDNKTYAQGEYIPISVLNTLKSKTGDSDVWGKIDDSGVVIHNAVFAGGNTSSGSDKAYANATSVFGNATASIHDVYHRDLITIGTGRTGGLYGDGNLTFVDGYRGLNITNYGTDYYNISPTVTYDEYEHQLTERERAYYELRYKCIKECTDDKGKTYYPASNGVSASTISLDDLKALFAGQTGSDQPGEFVGDAPNTTYWQFNGVCSRYAGRMMNTIQRADFCGVFGSRMVMMGAQDRVPTVVDYTNYTINRVREVSLNKKEFSTYSTAETDDKNKLHGNYFGIYSVVNYLGALTSDVKFSDTRTTNANTTNYPEYAPNDSYKTFYQWKENYWNDPKRNNGSSHNQVALASGVYLELTTEQSTGTGLLEKDWGYITGIIELDLINVQPGMGGGFVYAKNVHGEPSTSSSQHVTLTKLNEGAATRKSFEYNTTETETDQKHWETSGNFVHSTLTIIDDCYNVGGKYMGKDKVPAHYWFIKGSVYVYDQYISAYTGAPNAYSEVVDIPLTITAASHGTMKLLDVQPNLYAYYRVAPSGEVPGVKLNGDDKLEINNVTYRLNDPITYWDYQQMTTSQQALFVPMTYVTIEDCKIGSTSYKKGTILSPKEYNDLGTPATYVEVTGLTVGESEVTGYYTEAGGSFTAITEENEKAASGITYYKKVDFTSIFRSSNNLSHENGYILTYKVNNPSIWDEWYTKKEASGKDQTGGDDYEDGPTYRLKGNENRVLGQLDYEEGNIIPEDVYYTYVGKANDPNYLPGGVKGYLPDTTNQARFERAYLVTSEVETETVNEVPQHLYPGVAVAKSHYTDENWNAMSSHVEEAYVCTSTIQLSETEYIYTSTKMTDAEKQAYINRFKDNQVLKDLIGKSIVPAYYCTFAGSYGGNYYEANHNYRAIDAWSSMSAEDRDYFTFNYDALDLLIDSNFGRNEGKKYQYDADITGKTEAEALAAAQANAAGYSLTKPVDYVATYNIDDPLTLDSPINVIGSTTSTNVIKKNDELTREVFESLPNEQRHYAPIVVKEGETGDTCYVVNSPFVLGNSPYAVGNTIDKATFDNLGEYQANIDTLTNFPAAGKYYYCRESYTPSKGNIQSAGVGKSYTSGDVPIGVVIAEGDANSGYKSLPNKQKNFAIHGEAPVETSTLYVARNSDIYDLSKERIYTVIYEYDYEVNDQEGNVTPYSERHVLNIHVNFKSGIPTIEDINAPRIVLPGTNIGMREPVVTPGAYEITGGGWELFERIGDAESHTNGIPFSPNSNPLYWYQNGYFLEYYALTYLGKTYSNPVQVSVANYHDLKKVMEDMEHHYYVDHKGVDRYPKIYINDYSQDATGSKNGLDLFKNFFDLSVLDKPTLNENTELISSGDFAGHAPLNNRVTQGKQLEFILHSNINHSGSWTPIGTESSKCFEGNLHGDGYYISGLDKSLFASLCGNVYNLGVMGSFTGAGIVDTGDGFVENCWVKSTATTLPEGQSKVNAVFGNPTDSTGLQLVNSYFWDGNKALYNTTEENGITTSGGDRGKARAMTQEAFYNGEVAYDLNYFYLSKRYYDNNNEWRTGSKKPYSYYTVNGTNASLILHRDENDCGYYPSEFVYYPLENNEKTYGYVENRYADGDFIYAEGTIPETTEKRFDITSHKYFPIYPDDYQFFGQTLTYGYHVSNSHQDVPSSRNSGNRVYRAPAYFQNNTMGVVHFNPDAVLAAYSAPKTINDTNLKKAYPNMTAIDFAGHSDLLTGPYKLDLNDGKFFQPLLDDDGLNSIVTKGETQNLLVYAPSTEQNAQTHGVLTGYFKDPRYDDYDEPSSYYTDGNTYGRVAIAPIGDIHGHLIQSNLVATTDHLLVDKEDFNCPIAYTFDSDKRMWYQRKPKNYVNDKTKGWEGFCLPFTAQYVATNDKGELTHFYQGNTQDHEYWLREFKGGDISTDNNSIFIANMSNIAPGTHTKKYSNLFLRDYYYGQYESKDKNSEVYKKDYYFAIRTYNNYPYIKAYTPYIAGFPGERYYEFDLSGKFIPANTYGNDIEALQQQTITFVSDVQENIAVSDTEMQNVTATSGYCFYPNYLNTEKQAEEVFILNDEGSSFVKNTTAAKVIPFRPYFAATSGAPKLTRTIIFSDKTGDINDDDASKDKLGEGFDIRGGKRSVVVTSNLKRTADVRIFNISGLCIANFSIKPGETITHPIYHDGVYIVHAAHGRYIKKLVVD